MARWAQNRHIVVTMLSKELLTGLASLKLPGPGIVWQEYLPVIPRLIRQYIDVVRQILASALVVVNKVYFLPNSLEETNSRRIANTKV